MLEVIHLECKLSAIKSAWILLAMLYFYWSSRFLKKITLAKKGQLQLLFHADFRLWHAFDCKDKQKQQTLTFSLSSFSGRTLWTCYRVWHESQNAKKRLCRKLSLLQFLKSWLPSDTLPMMERLRYELSKERFLSWSCGFFFLVFLP